MSNIKFSDLGSKARKIDYLKQQLATNDRLIVRALVEIYAHQTADEQRVKETSEHNGVGFTGIDGHLLSSFAERAVAKRADVMLQDRNVEFCLARVYSEQQIALLKRKMPKYASQLLKIIDSKAQQQSA